MKMKTILRVFAVSALFATSAAQAQTTIDFEDVPTGACAGSFATLVSRGYSFSGIDDGIFICDANLAQHNTSPALINANARSVVTMTKQGGGTFSLTSFFAGGRTEDFDPDAPVTGYDVATGLQVTGTLFGGGTVSTAFTLDSDAPYDFKQYFLSAAFANLTSVVFTAQGDETPEFVIDDIVVNGQVVGVVPEPSTYAMMLLGVAATFGVARKRRRTLP